MLKARAHRQEGSTTTTIMLLGLSSMNLQKLQEGLPLAFDATPLGFQGEVIIVWGETEQDIVDGLRSAGIAIPDVPNATGHRA